MSSDLRIDGSATLTTVLSSMIMKSPTETAPSVHHFLFSSVTNRCIPLPFRPKLALAKLTDANAPRQAPRTLPRARPVWWQPL